MRWSVLLASSLSVALSLPSSAATTATVQTIEGTLAINRGDGFAQVMTWAEAPVGSQVMANPNSSGKVVYPDGCEISLTPGLLYTIQEVSPCHRGILGGTTGYIVGGLLVAGGVVAIVALTGGDDNGGGGKKRDKDRDQPASP